MTMSAGARRGECTPRVALILRTDDIGCADTLLDIFHCRVSRSSRDENRASELCAGEAEFYHAVRAHARDVERNNARNTLRSQDRRDSAKLLPRGYV